MKYPRINLTENVQNLYELNVLVRKEITNLCEGISCFWRGTFNIVKMSILSIAKKFVKTITIY